jgi:hypothetical protein
MGSTIKRIGSSGVIVASKAFVKDLLIRPKSAFLEL